MNLKPQQIVTRFVLPFSFDQKKVKEVSEELLNATIPSRSGKQVKIWEDGEVPRLYREELLQNVRDFLFSGVDNGPCTYLRVGSTPCDKWFQNVRAHLVTEDDQKKAQDAHRPVPSLVKWPIVVAPRAGIEIFLTTYGVGLLSIGLQPHNVDAELETTILFNYRLVQSRANVARGLRKDHPLDGSPREEPEMETHARVNVGPPPPAEAPLQQRLSVPGGEFRLWEFAHEILLAPLAKWGLKQFQNQFSVYTCIQFDDTIDFTNAEAVKVLAPFLSAITRVEEPTHAGVSPDNLSVRNEILNRRHWTAAGLLGTTHIVANQPDNHPFNDQRIPHVSMKYFAPYLAVMIQRAALHKTIGEASDYVLHGHEKQLPQVVAELRRRMLKFAVEGYFPEISHRDPVDHYYRMLQQGLGVRRAYDDVNRAVADMDKQMAAEHQADVQHKIGLLERFVISVYAAELFHLVATHTEWLHHYMVRGIIGSALAGFAAAWAVERLWKKRARDVS